MWSPCADCRGRLPAGRAGPAHGGTVSVPAVVGRVRAATGQGPVPWTDALVRAGVADERLRIERTDDHETTPDPGGIRCRPGSAPAPPRLRSDDIVTSRSPGSTGFPTLSESPSPRAPGRQAGWTVMVQRRLVARVRATYKSFPRRGGP